jgi:hypothetical protein
MAPLTSGSLMALRDELPDRARSIWPLDSDGKCTPFCLQLGEYLGYHGHEFGPEMTRLTEGRLEISSAGRWGGGDERRASDLRRRSWASEARANPPDVIRSPDRPTLCVIECMQ